MSLKILVLEDDPMQLELLERFLARDAEVVASAGAAHVPAEVDRIDPDVLLLDLNVPGLAKAAFPDFVASLAGKRVKVVLFSASDTGILRKMAADTGAHGYISKSESLAELASKLRAIVTPR